MNSACIDEFELLLGKVDGLYNEILTLSKKSPTDVLSRFKLQVTNDLLAGANDFLVTQKQDLPLKDFQRFGDDSLPSYSDVVVVLSQYLQSLEALRTKNIYQDYDLKAWFWVVDRKRTGRAAAPPARFK